MSATCKPTARLAYCSPTSAVYAAMRPFFDGCSSTSSESPKTWCFDTLQPSAFLLDLPAANASEMIFVVISEAPPSLQLNEPRVHLQLLRRLSYHRLPFFSPFCLILYEKTLEKIYHSTPLLEVETL